MWTARRINGSTKQASRYAVTARPVQRHPVPHQASHVRPWRDHLAASPILSLTDMALSAQANAHSARDCCHGPINLATTGVPIERRSEVPFECRLTICRISGFDDLLQWLILVLRGLTIGFRNGAQGGPERVTI